MNKKLEWHDWNNQSFKKAHEEDKLILLDITASWCHWCHVMDSTTYEDESVISYIEDNYMPIRVDRDKRPDIDGIYNLGGWPSTVILTPEGEILTGGTYMQPIPLLYMLKDTKKLYKENKKDIKEKIRKEGRAKSTLRIKAISHSLEYDAQAYVHSSIIDMYDSRYGGFGKKPKFLYPEVLSYLARQYFLSHDDKAKKILIKTLDIMYGSEVYDGIDGGFFRYATQRDFSGPHYEKLLDENAHLMSVYLEAYQMFNLPRYMDAAEDILKYIENNLYDDTKGLFYGSQNADETYYNNGFKQRIRMKKPALDKTYYTDKNSLCILAILKYYCITGKEEYLQIAVKAVDVLSKDLTNDSSLMKHHQGSDNANTLEDQVYMMELLLRFYSLTGRKAYMDKSLKLMDRVIEEFYDGKDKGFFDYLPIDEIKHYQPLKSLNLNSEISKVLMRLFMLTDIRKYYQYCQETLTHFSCIYREYGIFAVNYAEAVRIFAGDAYRIILIGKSDDHDTINLFNGLKKLYNPVGITQFLDIDKNREEIKKMGLDDDSYPKIYVCTKDKCLPPADSIKDLKGIFYKLTAEEELN